MLLAALGRLFIGLFLVMLGKVLLAGRALSVVNDTLPLGTWAECHG